MDENMINQTTEEYDVTKDVEIKEIDVPVEDVESEILVEETMYDVVVEPEEEVLIDISESMGWVGGDNRYHDSLLGVDFPRQHPITAIEGLREELDEIEALKMVYSNKPNTANYYAWSSGSYDEFGYFVSLVPHTSTIKICEGADIFGVTVDTAGFVGNQDEDVPRDNSYALVATTGLVDVRCESNVVESDYVISNAYGRAEKTTSSCGYKVIAVNDKQGTLYASIALGVQACTTDNLGKNLQHLKTRVDNNEINIAAAMNTANDAYNKSVESDSVSEEAVLKALEALDQANGAKDATDKMNKVLESVNNTAAQAKAIAEGAVIEAGRIKQEAYDTANDALSSVNNLVNKFEPLNEWVDPTTGQVGAEYIINYMDEQGLATKVEVQTVEKTTEENKSWIATNGESIAMMVSSVDKYSVGEYSQAYGLTLEQARNILKEGMIYIPTKHGDVATHTETYSDDVDYSFTHTFYYVWTDNMWSEGVGKVWFGTKQPSGDAYTYWYDGDKLYLLNDGKWLEVATLAGNVNNRITSVIRQDVDEVRAEIVNAYGSIAGFGAKLSDTDAKVNSIASWPITEGIHRLATIEQKASGDDSSLVLAAGTKEDGSPNLLSGATIVLSETDDGSYINIDADRINFGGNGTKEMKFKADNINFTATADYSVLAENITLSADRLTFGGDGTKEIQLDANHINFKADDYTIDAKNINFTASNLKDISGRNYIKYGKGNKKLGFFENFNTVTDGYGEHTLTSQNKYVILRLDSGFVLGCFDYEDGKQVTWSYDIMYTNWDFPEGTSVGELWMGQRHTAPTWARCTSHALPQVNKNNCELNKWFRFEHTMTIHTPEGEDYTTTPVIQFYNPNPDVPASITFRIKNVKLEYGDVATDWSPALEEYSTTDEVNSSIKMAVDRIDLTTYKSFTDLQGDVQEAEAKINLAVLTDKDGNLESSIKIGANKLEIDTDNFKLDGQGKIVANSGDFAGWEIKPDALYKKESGISSGMCSINSDTPITEGLVYALNAEGTAYTVTGYTGTDEIICIPSEYNSLPVTGIGNFAFQQCYNITSVIIPDSITNIGTYVFRGCNNLTMIIVGKGLTNIGNYMFENASSLVKIVIPDNITSIGEKAFRGCTNLTNINIPSSVTSIGEYAFDDCTSLQGINFGKNSKLTNIGNYAFYDCITLANIIIPNSVTSIGTGAFSGCTGLMSAEIPDSVTTLGAGVFLNCKNLTVYCEAESKPDGWNDMWKSGVNQVIWGHTPTVPLYGCRSLVVDGASSAPRFFAGSQLDMPHFSDDANFLVLEDGSLYASAAKIDGSVVSKEGSIGNLIITEGGLMSKSNDSKNFSLSDQGLVLEKSSAKIKVGDVTLKYDSDEETTVLETSGTLVLRGQNDTGLVFMKDTSNQTTSSAVYIWCQIIPSPTNYHNATVWITSDSAPMYAITYDIEWQSVYTAIFGNDVVVNNGIVSITLEAGSTESSKVSIKSFRGALQFHNYDDKTYYWSNRVANTDYPTAPVTKVGYFLQTKSPNNLYVTGNLLPSEKSESEDTGYNLGGVNNLWNTVYARTPTISASDKNKKNTIQSLSDVHTQIFDSLNPVSYKFNVNNNNRTHLGLIAQDVKEAVENAGLTTQDFAGYCEWTNDDGSVGCGLRYSEFIALCIDQIQKLKKRVEELENKLNTIQND